MFLKSVYFLDFVYKIYVYFKRIKHLRTLTAVWNQVSLGNLRNPTNSIQRGLSLPVKPPFLTLPNPPMQNSDYWTVKAGNKALTCLETILNPHTPGYHTNWPAWKRQIAGFGWEWQSQILHLALPRCSQGHGRQNTIPGPPWLTHAPAHPPMWKSEYPVHQKEARRSTVYLFLCVFEKGMSVNNTIGRQEGFQWCHPEPFSPNFRQKRGRGGGKRQNPSLIIIHGTDCPFWIFSFPTRHSILAALTSANQRVGIRVSTLSKRLRIWQTMASEPSRQWERDNSGKVTVSVCGPVLGWNDPASNMANLSFPISFIHALNLFTSAWCLLEQSAWVSPA